MAVSKIKGIIRGKKNITLTQGASTNIFSDQPGLYIIMVQAQNMGTGGIWSLGIRLNGSSTSTFELLDNADLDWKRSYATFYATCSRLDVYVSTLPSSPSGADVSYIKIA